MLDFKQNQNRVVVNRGPRVATTIGRKMVARPTSNTILTKKNEVVIKRTNQTQTMADRQAQMARRVQSSSQPEIARPTAQELKATAIEKALASTIKEDASVKEKKPHMQFGFKRILLALVCSAMAVFAIVYFVNLNAPNISLKVAAMQTGIEASYPSYVPRDYRLSDITSENGKITLNFTNSSAGKNYSLIEEKSSWDTNALLNNYVRRKYDDDYTVIKEQGLTIYVSNDGASWVNGGIVYKLDFSSDTLTKKQIKSIAVSL